MGLHDRLWVKSEINHIESVCFSKSYPNVVIKTRLTTLWDIVSWDISSVLHV